MNEQVKEEYQNKNKLLDAYDIYRKLKSRDVKIEDMTKEEKEAWTLVTRDRKFMSVLDSFPQGVEPSLVDILPKYNALLDESKTITKDQTPSQRIKQVVKHAPLIGKNYTTDINGTEPMHTTPIKPTSKGSKLPMTPTRKTLSPEEKSQGEPILPVQGQTKKMIKLNQIGYANIVLMSIIIIIIVAIICVFIFVK